MDLRLEVGERHGATAVAVEGEVDIATAPQLRQMLADLGDRGQKRVIIDLSRTDFLDSTGLGVLVAALTRYRKNDGDLILVCPKRPIRQVFEITRLDSVFTIFDSLADALAAPSLVGADAGARRAR